MTDPLRRAAIVGSARIPFARSNTAYIDYGNLEMLTAAMSALVDKFALKHELLGEVAAGAVIKHSRDWNLAREATLGAGLDPRTPACAGTLGGSKPRSVRAPAKPGADVGNVPTCNEAVYRVNGQFLRGKKPNPQR